MSCILETPQGRDLHQGVLGPKITKLSSILMGLKQLLIYEDRLDLEQVYDNETARTQY